MKHGTLEQRLELVSQALLCLDVVRHWIALVFQYNNIFQQCTKRSDQNCRSPEPRKYEQDDVTSRLERLGSSCDGIDPDFVTIQM